MFVFVFCFSLFLSSQILGAELAVNGDFETANTSGWGEWQAPWTEGALSYDYDWADNPFEGSYAFHMSAAKSSFGVYQEFCVEPDVPFVLEWAWKGQTGGANGWWEVLIIDGPYSYEQTDLTPEANIVAKWEAGFGGAFPAPSAEWTEEDASLTPSTDMVAVVLKCGTSAGPVEVWFDKIVAMQDSTLVEIDSVTPDKGSPAGGEILTVSGRIFPSGTTIQVGAKELLEPVRLSSCTIQGTVPASEAGVVDVTVTTPSGSFTLPEAYRYVGPPVIETITPAEGSQDGGTPLTITGENFEELPESLIHVWIGDAALLNLTVVDNATITGETPPGTAGAVDVVVTTPFGETTLAGGFTYDATAQPLFLRGNCNSDAAVNIADAVKVLSYLFGDTDDPLCLEACNANDDSDVNIADAVAILSYLFGGGEDLPAPSAACGVDPTPSTSCAQTQPEC